MKKMKSDHDDRRIRRSRLRAAMARMVPLALILVLCVVLPAGAGEKAPPKPGSKDKCPVCGMFVAPYPPWIATVSFTDGSHLFFDGPKDLFRYLLDRKKYDPPGKIREIGSVFVTGYYDVLPVDAKKAWYVTGSDVNGPMGRELVPLAGEGEAKTFLADHKGRKILRFHEVTTDVLKDLD